MSLGSVVVAVAAAVVCAKYSDMVFVMLQLLVNDLTTLVKKFLEMFCLLACELAVGMLGWLFILRLLGKQVGEKDLHISLGFD